MKPSRILLITSLPVLLLSCVRDPVRSNNTPATGRLARVIEIDSSRVHDTVAYTNIAYDEHGRPGMWTYTEFNGSSGDTVFQQRFLYHYASPQDSLCDFSTEWRRNWASPITEELVKYYTWNATRLAKDSLLSSMSARNYVSRYTGSSTGVALDRQASSFRTSGFFHQQYSGSDLLYQLDTLQTVSNGQTQYYRNEFTTSYRTEENPFSFLARPIFEPFINDDWRLDTWFNAPRHLIAQRVHSYRYWNSMGVSSSPSLTTTNYFYVFDAAGRAVEVRTTSTNGPNRLLLLQYY